VLCLAYPGSMIKGISSTTKPNNDFTICLGKKSQIVYNGYHEEQDFRRRTAARLSCESRQTGDRHHVSSRVALSAS
jgi:hypothetical protein